uniref:leucine-rich repeat protein n=1 Tax=Butyrivibrio sp. VCD2006 TaxID=1280664 RepID=UPI000478EE17
GMKDIWIGEKVTTFAYRAFYGCSTDTLTIHGVAGSPAEAFATENGFKFSTERLEEANAVLRGKVVDSSDNGVAGITVSIFDVTENKHITNSSTDGEGGWEFRAATAGHSYRIGFSSSKYVLSPKTISCVAQSDTELEDVIATARNLEETDGKYFEYTKTTGNNIRITKYTGSLETVVIPETIDGYTVREIGNDVFKEKTGLKKVVIPDSVTVIGNYVFHKTTTLEEVIFGAEVTSVGEYAFMGCTSLKTVNMSEGLLSIGYRAFMGCTNLTAIVLPDTLQRMGTQAFADCTELTTVNYPIALKSCDGNTFSGDLKLTSITIPDGVKRIASSVFSGSNISNITMPSTLEIIGEGAFQHDQALESIELPAG